MSLIDVNPVQKISKGSGGLFGALGKIGGTLVGGVAGGLLAGPGGAVQGAITGAGIGGGLGSLAGVADTPGSVSQSSPVPHLNIMQNMPEVQMASLVDGKKALYDSPTLSVPHKYQLASIYDSANEALRKSLQQGGVIG